MEKEFKGTNGTLVITENSVQIKKGKRGFFFSGALQGNKTIPYSSIVAVQFKEVGLTAGFLQLTLTGGSEAKKGLFQAIQDENTISFNTKKTSNIFKEAKEIIEQKLVSKNSNGSTKHSEADELEKYANLRDKGIITEEEFQTKKKEVFQS